YDSVSSLARRIARQYSPNGFLVVGVGPEITPLLTFLEIQRPGSTFPMGLNNFFYNPYVGPDDPSYVYSHRPIPEDGPLMQSLFNYWDHFFPTEEEMQGRSVILVGYSKDGEMIFSLQNYLAKYFQRKGRSVALTNMIFTERINHQILTENATRYRILETNSILLDGRHAEFLAALAENIYGPYSEVIPFDVADTRQMLRPNHAAHQMLVLLLARKMQADPALGVRTVTVRICGEIFENSLPTAMIQAI
ncbi:MAG: hypothetical protein WCG27_08990, partial [Pseudomonadota bacterium]